MNMWMKIAFLEDETQNVYLPLIFESRSGTNPSKPYNLGQIYYLTETL